MREQLKPDIQARVDGGQRFLEWLIPRLAGSADEKETTVVMVLAQLSARYADGIHDAADVAIRFAKQRPASREASAIAWALDKLEQRHRAEPITSLDDPA